jgi:anthranilate synthase component 1
VSPNRVTPDLDSIRRLAAANGPAVVPVYRQVLADLETPAAAFLRLSTGPGSFLLESVEGGQHLARYSFVGFDLRSSLELFEAGAARLSRDGQEESLTYADPLDLIDALVTRPGVVRSPGLPRFVGGAVGYLSYEVARAFERLPAPERDPLGLPLGHLMLVDTLLVFDHLRRTAMAITHVSTHADLEAEYEAAERRIEAVLDRLAAARAPYSLAESGFDDTNTAPVSSNFSRHEFEGMVRQAKEHIAAGDVIQVVLSQRLSIPTQASAFSIYRALRSVNPSPYMYFLDYGEYQLIGASPELLVLVEDGTVSTHPIAGTRRRGRTPPEDRGLAEELLADEKERAEHVMLVDLGRNDVGRVAVPGSVTVPQLMEIEYYSHVMHIVSHVQGRLKPELRPVDALRACFPAGTVSGAPKIRAMELIAEFEPDRRGPYAGAVGFFGLNGDVESAITIRTIVLKDGVAHVQAGAGIVADSDPAAEYQETLSKAEALVSAVRRADALTGGETLTPTRSQGEQERTSEGAAVPVAPSSGTASPLPLGEG